MAQMVAFHENHFYPGTCMWTQGQGATVAFMDSNKVPWYRHRDQLVLRTTNLTAWQPSRASCRLPVQFQVKEINHLTLSSKAMVDPGYDTKEGQK